MRGVWLRRSTLGLRTAMQQQYQLSFSMPLAPAPKKQHQENDLQLPDDLAMLQTVRTCTHPVFFPPPPPTIPPCPTLHSLTKTGAVPSMLVSR